jgi:hypothetical protein
MGFCVLEQATMNAIIFLGFLKLFEAIAWMVAFQQAVACNIWTHSWKVMGFWRFTLSSGMLLAIVNAGKSTQNCPNLPKSAKRLNFEILAKIEILVFFKNKNFYM